MWSVVFAVVLIVYICVMILYAAIPSSTRAVLLHCKRGHVCHLTDAFKMGKPWIPMVLFEYYNTKDYTPKIQEEMNLYAKKTGIPYIVVNKRSDYVFHPPSLPLHVSLLI